MKVKTPNILTDGGPWASHDMPCPVFWKYESHAVLDIETGVFHPSHAAKAEGWMTIKAPRWIRWFLKRYERGATH